MSITGKVLSIKVLLGLIVILAALLRIPGIADYPSGLNADEAAIGYNAYSLLQTGKDEYGNPWPLSFVSFGDYKPGLYFYMVMPFIASLGINELAVRLPSALFGIGTVLLVYFLAKELFNQKGPALASSLILAITPWHIHFSRGSWETNAATFFICLGVYLFIKKLGDPWYLFFSFLSFLIAMYTYQSPRLVVPVLVLGMLLLYFKNLFHQVKNNQKIIKSYVIILTVLSVLAVPLAFQFLGGSGSARFAGLSFLSDKGPENRLNELRGQHADLGSLQAKIFHNKLTAFAPQFFGHYVDHFKGDFLFINGDPIIRNKTPETGQFYLIMALFLVIGLFVLLKSESSTKWLVLLWLFVSPLASSMTYQTPNAVRALLMVIPLVLMMGLGMSAIIDKLWNLKYLKGLGYLMAIFIFVWIGFEMTHYLESYYIHSPKRYPLAWEYGFKEMVGKMESQEQKFAKIVVTDRYDQPYILVLFYKAMLAQQNGVPFNPSDYQGKLKLSERDKFNFGTVRDFDKFQFKAVTPEEILQSKDTLYIVTPKEVPPGRDIIDSVKYPNGEDAFVFVKT